MTRAERAAVKVQKEKEKAAELERLLKEKLSEQHAETRKAEAALREETRKADNKRRYHVGALAQEAGLFVWTNTDLAGVFAMLAHLGNVPNPAAVLEGLLGCGVGADIGGDNGFPEGKPLSRRLSSPAFSARPEGENSALRS